MVSNHVRLSYFEVGSTLIKSKNKKRNKEKKSKKLELGLKKQSCPHAFAMKTSVATELLIIGSFVGFSRQPSSHMPSVFLSSVTRQTNVHRFTEQ